MSAKDLLVKEIEAGNLSEVKKILTENPSLLNQGINSGNHSPLTLSIDKNKFYVCDVILGLYGLNVNYEDISNQTALILMACRDTPLSLFSHLLSFSGLRVNHPNINGWTVLHAACGYGRTEMVRALLSHRDIDPTIKAKDGKMACDVICCYSSDKSPQPIIQKLLKKWHPFSASIPPMTPPPPPPVSLQEELKKIEEEIKTLQQQISQLASTNSQLSENLQQEKSRNVALEKENVELSQALNNKSDLASSLKEDLEKEKMTVKHQETRNQQLETENQKNFALATSLSEELAKKVEIISSTTIEAETLKTENERLSNELKRFSLSNNTDEVDQIALMEELDFPLDLRCSCVVVFLEAEKAKLRSLTRGVDVSVKLAVGQRLKTLKSFLSNYSVGGSGLMMKMEELEGVLADHDEHLLTEYMDGEKILKMDEFLGLFKKAQSQLPVSKTSSVQGLQGFSKNLLPKPLPVLAVLPLPHGKETHCFLTHNWANGNHEKVMRINEALKRRGLVTWFDSERMKDQIRHVMAEALAKTASVVIFLTKIYEEKINNGNEADNCYFEFNFVSHHPTLVNKRIAAATEQAMTYPSGKWDTNRRLFSEMGGYLVLDVSEEEDESIFEKQIDELATRITEKISY